MKNELMASVTQFLLYATRKCWPWIGANCIGLISYTALAPISWPTQTTEGPVSTGGDAIIWGLTELPVLFLFFFVNLAWLTAILWRKDKQAGIAWSVTAIAWTGLLALDMRVFRQAVDL